MSATCQADQDGAEWQSAISGRCHLVASSSVVTRIVGGSSRPGEYSTEVQQPARTKAYGSSNISGANEFAGSRVGSQRGATPGDIRPRPATETAGKRHTWPRPATPGDGRSVYGMQEVRSSSLRSSTSSCTYFEHLTVDYSCPSGAFEGQVCGQIVRRRLADLRRRRG